MIKEEFMINSLGLLEQGKFFEKEHLSAKMPFSLSEKKRLFTDPTKIQKKSLDQKDNGRSCNAEAQLLPV
ncbi:hypothetical protein H206_02174 [Candidatus Electrothrix aarhusensis]|uniref:Uncharacterized protein n=1 Tax=Candidatus Electrothrix aarhusensis TaxID=1859131 RepID=A0A3S4T8U4_9BACT|nr:hypothetical protein H206_02174 [Candidatus Electrothrix aarhusensis]